MEKAKSERDSTNEALLQRLFPNVKVSKSQPGKHEAWLETFAKSLQDQIKAKEEPKKEVAKVDTEEISKLEKQVEQYKTVLAQTVSFYELFTGYEYNICL